MFNSGGPVAWPFSAPVRAAPSPWRGQEVISRVASQFFLPVAARTATIPAQFRTRLAPTPTARIRWSLLTHGRPTQPASASSGPAVRVRGGNRERSGAREHAGSRLDRASDASRAAGADRRPRGRHGPQAPADRGGRAQAAGETRAARPGPGPGLGGPVGRGRAGVRPLPPAVQHERRSGATVRRARPCRRRASGAAGSTAAPAGSPPGRPSGTTTRPAHPRLGRARPPADR